MTKTISESLKERKSVHHGTAVVSTAKFTCVLNTDGSYSTTSHKSGIGGKTFSELLTNNDTLEEIMGDWARMFLENGVPMPIEITIFADGSVRVLPKTEFKKCTVVSSGSTQTLLHDLAVSVHEIDSVMFGNAIRSFREQYALSAFYEDDIIMEQHGMSTVITFRDYSGVDVPKEMGLTYVPVADEYVAGERVLTNRKDIGLYLTACLYFGPNFRQTKVSDTHSRIVLNFANSKAGVGLNSFPALNRATLSERLAMQSTTFEHRRNGISLDRILDLFARNIIAMNTIGVEGHFIGTFEGLRGVQIVPARYSWDMELAKEATSITSVECVSKARELVFNDTHNSYIEDNNTNSEDDINLRLHGCRVIDVSTIGAEPMFILASGVVHRGEQILNLDEMRLVTELVVNKNGSTRAYDREAELVRELSLGATEYFNAVVMIDDTCVPSAVIIRHEAEHETRDYVVSDRTDQHTELLAFMRG